MINNILKKYLDKFYIVYLDDILIFLNNKEEYIEYIYYKGSDNMLRVVPKVLPRTKSTPVLQVF